MYIYICFYTCTGSPLIGTVYWHHSKQYHEQRQDGKIINREVSTSFTIHSELELQMVVLFVFFSFPAMLMVNLILLCFTCFVVVIIFINILLFISFFINWYVLFFKKDWQYLSRSRFSFFYRVIRVSDIVEKFDLP